MARDLGYGSPFSYLSIVVLALVVTCVNCLQGGAFLCYWRFGLTQSFNDFLMPSSYYAMGIIYVLNGISVIVNILFSKGFYPDLSGFRLRKRKKQKQKKETKKNKNLVNKFIGWMCMILHLSLDRSAISYLLRHLSYLLEAIIKYLAVSLMEIYFIMSTDSMDLPCIPSLLSVHRRI